MAARQRDVAATAERKASAAADRGEHARAGGLWLVADEATAVAERLERAAVGHADRDHRSVVAIVRSYRLRRMRALAGPVG